MKRPLALSLSLLAVATTVAVAHLARRGGEAPEVAAAPRSLSGTSHGSFPESRNEAPGVAVGVAEAGRRDLDSLAAVSVRDGAGLIRVRSSLGLPVREVFVSTPPSREEERVEVAADGMVLAGLPRDAVVRAPGHRPAPVASAGPEGAAIPLEPFLGVTFELPRLRERLEAVTVAKLPAVEPCFRADALVAGFVGPDRFAVALDPDRYWDRFQEGVYCTFEALDDSENDFELDLRARGTFTCALTLTDLPLTACTVGFRCEPGCRAEKRYRLWPSYSWAEARFERSEEVWGVVLSAGKARRDVEASTTGPEVTFGSLVTGREYGISALCPEHGRYGRVFFTVGPGARATVPLLKGVVVTGRVDPPLTESLLLQGCGDPEDSSMRGRWEATVSLPVERDGSFRFLWPIDVPITKAARWPLPRPLHLRLTMPTCRTVALDVELPEEGSLDLGTLHLPCDPDPLVLAPGNGFDRDDPEPVRCIRLREADGTTSEEYLDSQRWTGDGALLLSMNGSLRGHDGSLPDALIAFDDERSCRCFLLVDGRYVAVPAGTRTLRVHLTSWPEDGQQLYCGWTWRGIDMCIETLDPRQVGEVVPVRTPIPADADRFWWASDFTGPADARLGAAVSLDGGRGEFHVP